MWTMVNRNVQGVKCRAEDAGEAVGPTRGRGQGNCRKLHSIFAMRDVRTSRNRYVSLVLNDTPGKDWNLDLPITYESNCSGSAGPNPDLVPSSIHFRADTLSQRVSIMVNGRRGTRSILLSTHSPSTNTRRVQVKPRLRKSASSSPPASSAAMPPKTLPATWASRSGAYGE